MKWMLAATALIAVLLAVLFAAVALWTPDVAVDDADQAEARWEALQSQIPSWDRAEAWTLAAPGLVGFGFATALVALGSRWQP